MGKAILIKDKREEVFDKAQATAKGRKLLTTIETFKQSYVDIVELCGTIRELATEAGFNYEELNMLGAIVFDQVALSAYYKRKAWNILNPKIIKVDFEKLARKTFFNDPSDKIDDKVLYEGDYDVFVPYEILSPKNVIHMAKGEKGWYLRIRNGRPNNARLDTEDDWVNPEEWEISADLERKQIEAMI